MVELALKERGRVRDEVLAQGWSIRGCRATGSCRNSIVGPATLLAAIFYSIVGPALSP